MDKVAHLPARQRRDLFRESAARRGMRPAIVEKDFWVCWILKKLFADPFLKDRMVFKGGTTLSKVHRLIDRFSEDIDLVLDWRLLGYGTELSDPAPVDLSNTQLDRISKEINAKAAAYIAQELLGRLSDIFASVKEISVAVDPTDPHSVNVRYAAAFKETYLRPEVRLEIGPLASWIPSGTHTIQPYAAEDFPQVFDDPTCAVVAITAERTFWEKATILHQQAHRTNVMPPRYSRHYYDLYRLAESPVRSLALSDLKLLQGVLLFKQRFYPSAWARYDLAQPGTFQLSPKQIHLAELEKDYGGMAVMIFGHVPPFEAILEGLRGLEADINLLAE
jgi:hypothetical protein